MPIDNGYKYLCNIMDIFSRYAFGDAIKEKDENSVLNVIKKYVSLLGAPAQICKFGHDNRGYILG